MVETGRARWEEGRLAGDRPDRVRQDRAAGQEGNQGTLAALEEEGCQGSRCAAAEDSRDKTSRWRKVWCSVRYGRVMVESEKMSPLVLTLLYWRTTVGDVIKTGAPLAVQCHH